MSSFRGLERDLTCLSFCLEGGNALKPCFPIFQFFMVRLSLFLWNFDIVVTRARYGGNRQSTTTKMFFFLEKSGVPFYFLYGCVRYSFFLAVVRRWAESLCGLHSSTVGHCRADRDLDVWPRTESCGASQPLVATHVVVKSAPGISSHPVLARLVA